MSRDEDEESVCTQEHKDHAMQLVKMADMVTRSSEKTSMKTELNQFDESSGIDFMDSAVGEDLVLVKTASERRTDAGGADDAEEKSAEHGGCGEKKEDGDAGSGSGGAGGSSSVGSSSSKRRASSSSDAGRRSSKKDRAKFDAAATSSTSNSDLDTPASPTPASDESEASLKEQLTQTRRALLQVRENAKLKYRKLELEHTTSKKELKKAKEVIEKQTIEYKKLKIKLDGVSKERDDAKEELARELGGRGSLVSGISQENGRMIRRLREIRGERDKLQKERDELVQQLELCKCEAGDEYKATLTSSLAHETAPVTSAALSQRSFGLTDEVTGSAVSQRSFVSESRRNIFDSAMSIRSNLSDDMENEIEATKAEIAERKARRRNSASSHVTFKEEGGEGGLMSGMVIGFGGSRRRRKSGEWDEKEQQHDDGGEDASFISMSVRSFPSAVVSSTKQAVTRWSSTSMRSLMEEVDPEHKRPDVDFPSGGRRRRGRRSYEKADVGDNSADQANLAPRAGDVPQPSSSGSSFWAATSQRFLMGMADEASDA